MYQANSNNTSGVAREQKQSPKPLPKSAFGSVVAPVKNVIHDRPSYVTLNNAGMYKFLYSTTGSVGGYTIKETYSTGSVIDADAGPTRLDIQPVAWGGDTAGKTGDVTFVYRGGL
mgnify:FL=1|jgi:hypothetical protein|tara:strand:- start:6696 stop:7040 length:345 start_codon:yes stop_codon:yes gene_type:complete